MLYYSDDLVALHNGTARKVGPHLEPRSVRTIVTSPPYFGLRDYGHDDQIGAEASVGEYVQALVDTFAALRPALTDDGTL
jgi:DNA modification methylase